MKKYKILWLLVFISVITATLDRAALIGWFGFWVGHAIYDAVAGKK